MGLRETYGGIVESGLNEAIDKNLSKEKVMALVVEKLEQVLGENWDALLAKVKSDYIDLIDGEDDIPDSDAVVAE